MSTCNHYGARGSLLTTTEPETNANHYRAGDYYQPIPSQGPLPITTEPGDNLPTIIEQWDQCKHLPSHGTTTAKHYRIIGPFSATTEPGKHCQPLPNQGTISANHCRTMEPMLSTRDMGHFLPLLS